MVARRSRAVFGLTLVLVALVVALTGSLIELLDLGRRTATYEATGTSNFNFYFIAFVQYAIVAWVVWPNYSDKQVGDQFRMNSIFFVLAIGLSFFHETAVRLVFMSHALSVTNLGACASTRRGRWGMGTWVVLLVLLIAVETARSGNDPDAWIRRWGAILFG
jgi:hypothetical protein